MKLLSLSVRPRCTSVICSKWRPSPKSRRAVATASGVLRHLASSKPSRRFSRDEATSGDLVRRYKRENDLTGADLARRCKMSVTAIQGIIREDRTRYSDETQVTFLKKIGVSQEQWYKK